MPLDQSSRMKSRGAHYFQDSYLSIGMSTDVNAVAGSRSYLPYAGSTSIWIFLDCSFTFVLRSQNHLKFGASLER